MNYRDRITMSPDVMLGKPAIKGTRITVEFVIKKLSEGMDIDELLNEYSSLERDDILASLAYSADVISKEEILVS
ncbi:MAG TPA: DUF433 domain-containing protein [Spirochaetota bacterium]|nr:DUF433 domain-containing protein [Spirochaetota bacterium]HPS87061.1 DUF433 domain-containing protein [Spirochaetota bacterium]